MTKQLILSAAFCLTAGAAMADDFIKVPASGTVDATMDALVSAVEGAGATVFARVDHAAGAEQVGMELSPAQLLVFGNPKLGTPVIQSDPLAGLMLPLRVLVYEDAQGAVWLAYQEVDDMLDDLSVDDDSEPVKAIEGALERLTAAAAGN